MKRIYTFKYYKIYNPSDFPIPFFMFIRNIIKGDEKLTDLNIQTGMLTLQNADGELHHIYADDSKKLSRFIGKDLLSKFIFLLNEYNLCKILRYEGSTNGIGSDGYDSWILAKPTRQWIIIPIQIFKNKKIPSLFRNAWRHLIISTIRKNNIYYYVMDDKIIRYLYAFLAYARSEELIPEEENIWS